MYFDANLLQKKQITSRSKIDASFVKMTTDCEKYDLITTDLEKAHRIKAFRNAGSKSYVFDC